MSRDRQRIILHGIYLTITFTSFVLVQREVPDPYLDEIFHIPQTQAYCLGKWSQWDDSITTPPGLYILSTIILRLTRIPCSPIALRCTNLLLSLMIPGLLSSIIQDLSKSFFANSRQSKAFLSNTSNQTTNHQTLSNDTSNGIPKSGPAIAYKTPIHNNSFTQHLLTPSARAIIITSFPLIHFFQNLYYTDLASLVGVLGCWALALKGRHLTGAVVGTWSITVRQTNVVWVGFVLVDSILRWTNVIRLFKDRELDDQDSRKIDLLLRDVTFSSPLTSIFGTIAMILRNPKPIFRMVVPYLPTFFGFLVFVKWNGGIVLGHKELHKPVVHFPQILYWIAFSSILLLPALMAEGFGKTFKGAVRVGLGSPLKVTMSLVILGLMNVAVHRYTIIHPFLLADNRHYVFYLFRWVFIPFPMAKYAVTPIYLVCSWMWLWRLRNTLTFLPLISLLLCTTATLVPTPLIEPRYFLIPTIILRTYLASTPYTHDTPYQSKVSGLGKEMLWYSLINFATVGLFLGRKFKWDGWEGWMRFMW